MATNNSPEIDILEAPGGVEFYRLWKQYFDPSIKTSDTAMDILEKVTDLEIEIATDHFDGARAPAIRIGSAALYFAAEEAKSFA